MQSASFGSPRAAATAASQFAVHKALRMSTTRRKEGRMNESEGWLAKEIAPIEGILQPLVRPLPLAFRLGLFGRRSYAKSHSGRRPSAGQGDKQTSAACPSVNLSDCPFYFICPCTLPLHRPYVHSIQPSLHSICHHRRSLSDGPGDPFWPRCFPTD